MGSFGWIIGGIVATFFMIAIFTGLAVHNARFNQDIYCPYSPQELESLFVGNNTVIDIVFRVGASIFVLASPCSGLPWWVYVFMFVPLVIGIAVWLTPLIGQ